MLTVAVSAPDRNWAEASESDPCTKMVAVSSSRMSFTMGMSRLCTGDAEVLPEENVRITVAAV